MFVYELVMRNLLTKQAKLFLFISLIIIACGQRKVDLLNKTIELITLGPSDSVTTFNKGLGISTYCYINLENDSVFIMHKSIFDSPRKRESFSGTIKQLALNDTIIKGLLALDKLPSGEIQKTKTPTNAMYCGPTIYLKYTRNKTINIYFYTTSHLDTSILNLTSLILHLSEHSMLVKDSNEAPIIEDSLIAPLVRSSFFKMNPPPRLGNTIKFEAPKTGGK